MVVCRRYRTRNEGIQKIHLSLFLYFFSRVSVGLGSLLDLACCNSLLLRWFYIARTHLPVAARETVVGEVAAIIAQVVGAVVSMGERISLCIDLELQIERYQTRKEVLLRTSARWISLLLPPSYLLLPLLLEHICNTLWGLAFV